MSVVKEKTTLEDIIIFIKNLFCPKLKAIPIEVDDHGEFL